MRKFWKATADTLRADAQLMILTGYDAGAELFTIARGDFKGKGFKKGLFFLEDPGGHYLRGSDTTAIKDWNVEFSLVGETELVVADIADRFRELFEDVAGGFLDISNTDVHCTFSEIVDWGTARKDSDWDAELLKIVVRFVWSLKSP